MLVALGLDQRIETRPGVDGAAIDEPSAHRFLDRLSRCQVAWGFGRRRCAAIIGPQWFTQRRTVRDAALREQILDVTKAQCEPEIEPNRLMYDLGREPISGVTDFPHSLGYSAYLHPTSCCRRDKALPPPHGCGGADLGNDVSSGCATPPQRGRAASGASHAPDRAIERSGWLPRSRPCRCCRSCISRARARSTSEKSAVSSSWRGARLRTRGEGGRIEPRRELVRMITPPSIGRAPPESFELGIGVVREHDFQVTYSSPRAPPAPGAPFPLRRRPLPLFDHLGTVIVNVGTITLPLSTTCSSVAGSSTWMSSPLRANTGCGRTATSINASPGGPLPSPAAFAAQAQDLAARAGWNGDLEHLAVGERDLPLGAIDRVEINLETMTVRAAHENRPGPRGRIFPRKCPRRPQNRQSPHRWRRPASRRCRRSRDRRLARASVPRRGRSAPAS